LGFLIRPAELVHALTYEGVKEEEGGLRPCALPRERVGIAR